MRLICLFDHEEVGSQSATGAEGPLLRDSVSRIWAGLAPAAAAAADTSAAAFRARSFHISSDMAHAVHPNYADRHDKAHGPKLGAGLVLKHNANQRYATDAVAAALIRRFGALAGQTIQARPHSAPTRTGCLPHATIPQYRPLRQPGFGRSAVQRRSARSPDHGLG